LTLICKPQREANIFETRISVHRHVRLLFRRTDKDKTF